MSAIPRVFLVFCLLGSSFLGGRSAAAQGGPPLQDVAIDSDRPHLGTGPRIIAPGQVQIEAGGLYQQVARGRGTYGSPVLARVGITSFIEGRLGFDGVVGRFDHDDKASGVGNVQASAKIPLFRDGEGTPTVSILPAVTFGLASRESGLGSGDTDSFLTLLVGREMGRWHAEGNYGVGAIGAGAGRPHFLQHLVTAAIVRETTAAFSTYVEGVWFSRQEPAGHAVSFSDFGALYAINRTLLVDAGVSVGLSKAAPTFGLFGGCSVLIGEPHRRSPSRRHR